MAVSFIIPCDVWGAEAGVARGEAKTLASEIRSLIQYNNTGFTGPDGYNQKAAYKRLKEFDLFADMGVKASFLKYNCSGSEIQMEGLCLYPARYAYKSDELGQKIARISQIKPDIMTLRLLSVVIKEPRVDETAHIEALLGAAHIISVSNDKEIQKARRSVLAELNFLKNFTAYELVYGLGREHDAALRKRISAQIAVLSGKAQAQSLFSAEDVAQLRQKASYITANINTGLAVMSVGYLGAAGLRGLAAMPKASPAPAAPKFTVVRGGGGRPSGGYSSKASSRPAFDGSAALKIYPQPKPAPVMSLKPAPAQNPLAIPAPKPLPAQPRVVALPLSVPQRTFPHDSKVAHIGEPLFSKVLPLRPETDPRLLPPQIPSLPKQGELSALIQPDEEPLGKTVKNAAAKKPLNKKAEPILDKEKNNKTQADEELLLQSANVNKPAALKQIKEEAARPRPSFGSAAQKHIDAAQKFYADNSGAPLSFEVRTPLYTITEKKIAATKEQVQQAQALLAQNPAAKPAFGSAAQKNIDAAQRFYQDHPGIPLSAPLRAHLYEIKYRAKTATPEQKKLALELLQKNPSAKSVFGVLAQTRIEMVQEFYRENPGAALPEELRLMLKTVKYQNTGATPEQVKLAEELLAQNPTAKPAFGVTTQKHIDAAQKFYAENPATPLPAPQRKALHNITKGKSSSTPEQGLIIAELIKKHNLLKQAKSKNNAAAQSDDKSIKAAREQLDNYQARYAAINAMPKNKQLLAQRDLHKKLVAFDALTSPGLQGRADKEYFEELKTLIGKTADGIFNNFK